jgi:hypothetical protein
MMKNATAEQIEDLAREVRLTGRTDIAKAAAEILSERPRTFAALNDALDANENGKGGIAWKTVIRRIAKTLEA